jgi:excisionase family DNA binding protein
VAVASQDPIAVTIPTAASMLGCSVSAIRSFIRAGQIPYVRLGKKFVIAVAELHRFIQKEQVRS